MSVEHFNTKISVQFVDFGTSPRTSIFRITGYCCKMLESRFHSFVGVIITTISWLLNCIFSLPEVESPIHGVNRASYFWGLSPWLVDSCFLFWSHLVLTGADAPLMDLPLLTRTPVILDQDFFLLPSFELFSKYSYMLRCWVLVFQHMNFREIQFDQSWSYTIKIVH